MGSRRTTAQSGFGNGRSGNGNDVGGNGRFSSCSYLSNVRPETRSTLCSVMAQLAEETQPFFEETLKSKAVSEDSTVKFTCVVTGHPTPQITWYKDDKQLDRYCGLPKYEIFRNGQSHSLHIYNCTVEDAAIYQASAINSKGIVSCSGVLEVGEMNEFKIHQRYFAKLKQKVENRCREAQDKENQEYLRNISPDRTQRKRRSTAETSLSTSSLKEDEDNQEGLQAETPDAEFRLQEANAEDPAKKTVPVSDGAVCATTGGRASDDSKSRTLTSNPVQKIFTSHEQKSPFVKKKIKISNSAKVSKTDMLERTSTTNNNTEAVHTNGIADEVMEVENNVHSPDSHLDSTIVKEKHQKPATEKSALFKSFSENETPRSQATVFSQRFTKTVSPVATSSSCTSSEKEFKNKPKHENKGDHRERLETKNQSSQSSLKPTDQSVSKKGIHATGRVTAIKTNRSLKTSSDKYLQHLTSAAKSSDTRTASPQRSHEVAESRLSEKETSSCQKPESVSQPDQPREVTQAHAETNRNDAPVRSEPPPDQRTISSQPPENTDDIQTSCLSNNLQAKTVKVTQDMLDKSMQSSESCSVKKFPFDTRGPAENIPECNVSPATKPSQVDAAVKAVERAETQDVEKVEGNEVEELALSEEILETTAPEQIKTQKANDAGDNVATGNPSTLEKNEHQKRASTLVEKTVSELKKLKSHVSQTAFRDQTQTSANINSLQPIVDSTKHPKAESKVISVAELLRSQIKALETDANIADHTNLAQGLTTTAKDVLQEEKGDDIKCNGEAIIFKHDNKAVKSTNSTPPTSLKATLMKIYQDLNEEEGPAAALDVTSTKELLVSFRDPDAPTTELHARRDGAVKDFSSVSDDSRSKDLKDTPPSLPSKDAITEILQPETVIQTPGSSVRETQIKISILETNTENVKHTKDETVQDPNIKLIQTQSLPKTPNSKVERELKEVNVKLSDQVKMKQSELQPKDSESKSIPAKKETATQLVQQESSGIKECLRSDFVNNLTPEASPLMRRKHCTSPILSATPQELASGARRKLSTSSAKPEEAEETASSTDNQTQTNGLSVKSTKISTSTGSPGPSRQSPRLQPAGEPSSATERPSPLFSRRKTMAEAPTLNQIHTDQIHTEQIHTEQIHTEQIHTEQIHTEGKPAEKKHNPFKAPQVIRKIRAETFSDASGHLKLWCQFFNVLSDSKIKWYKNEEEIDQVNRNAGDETPVNLTIVQASNKDSGVYGCSITNEYGTDSTDLLLSAEILAGISLREDLGVGEEIEMTPLIFSKGLADSGTWRNKFFGRVMLTQSYIGDGCSHKVWRAKVIYGLEPVFESGDTCIIKVRSPITYGGKEESCLIERNLDIMKKECKIQNLAREYCKIFSAEARVIENFGPSLEVIPVYLMYRPANTVPYATVESDLGGGYKKYSVLDHAVKTDTRTGSEVEQKCCTFQHWIFQWTNGNLLLTRLEGVDTKITNVAISVRSTGHQGLSVEGNPKVFEHFVLQHKCNYFCGLLGLKPLKVMDSLTTPTKLKGSRSPLLQRKKPTSSSSPQPGRKAPVSPRQPRKAEQEGSNTHTEDKAADAPKVV